MATWTQAQTARRALENIGVLAAGQSPSAEDQERADEVVLSVHSMLLTLGLAPFAVSAIPEEAQLPFRDLVSEAMVGPWQIHGEKRLELAAAARKAKKDLYAQYAGDLEPLPPKAVYF